MIIVYFGLDSQVLLEDLPCLTHPRPVIALLHSKRFHFKQNHNHSGGKKIYVGATPQI